MKFKLRLYVQVFSFLFTLMTVSAYADIPQTVNFQGFLTDENNQAVEDGNYTMTFSLWTGTDENSSQLWSETQTVSVSRGIYSVLLGSSTAFPNTLTFADESYLGVQVGGGDYLKIGGSFIPLTTTWSAFRAQTSGGRIVKNVSSNYTITKSDDIICADGSITITLPSATGCLGKIYTIENIGTQSVSIETNGAQTIDDDASMTLDSKYDQVTLVSNGSGWYRLGSSGDVSLTEDNTMSGTLTVDNNTASSSTSTGALVVSGGAGISGKIFAGNDINTTANISAVAASFSGQLTAGNTTVNGELSVYDDESGKTVVIKSSGTGVEIENALDIENGTTKTGIAIGAGAGANSTTASTTTTPKIAIGYNAINNLGGNTALIRGTLYLDGADSNPIYYRNTFGSGNWTALEVGGGSISEDSVGYTELASSSVRTTELADDAVTITKITGVNSNDKVITTDDSGNTSWDYVKNAIQEYTVKEGETVTAGDIVQFVDGNIQKGVGGQSGEASFGNEIVYNEASTSYISVSSLSNNSFVIAYKETDNITIGSAIIGTVSGTSISWGDKYTFNNSQTDHISVLALTDSSFVVAYKDIVNNNAGKAIVGAVAGTTISWGEEYTFNSQANFISASRLTDNSFVVSYDSGGRGTSIIGTVTGTTINYGAPVNFNNITLRTSSVSRLSDTSFVIGFSDYSDNQRGKAIIGSVSDTTITFGNESVCNDAVTSSIPVASLDNSTFVAVYSDSYSGNTYGTAIVGAVSDTTISWGNEYTMNNTGIGHISISSLSSNSFAIAYNADGNLGKNIIGSVSGTSISWGNEYTYNPATTYNTSISNFNNSSYIITYTDNSNLDYGTAVISSVLNYNSLGIAINSGTGGGSIAVVHSGVVEGLSGLTANSKYYADDNGNLTTTETERFIGTALSTSSLIIQSDLPGGKFIEDGNIVVSKLSSSGGTGLENGNSGQVLQSNGDGTFSWADMIRLTPQSSAPATCDSSIDGMMALTSDYKLCICRPANWMKIEAADTMCAWTTD
jgi:hypothetical protein